MRLKPWYLLASMLPLLWSAGMVRAYRTAADDPSFPAQERPIAWRGAPLFRVVDDVPQGGSRGAILSAMIQGAELWQDECGVDYVFGGVTDRRAVAGDGVVTIEIVGSGWETRGFSPNAEATTEVVHGGVTGDFQILDADIYVRGDAFDFRDPSVLDRLAAVIAHEFGHVLGLLHSCGEAGAPSCSFPSVMHPMYVGAAELFADDVSGACALYPPNTVPCECGPGAVCLSGMCVSTCGDTVCGPGEFCDGACVPTGPVGCVDDCPSQFLGDPCERATECHSGVCDAGRCTSMCTEDALCPEAFDCTDGQCAPQLALPGESCSTGDDCVTGLCLEGRTTEPACVRACSRTEVPCSIGQQCLAVDGLAVCAPQRDNASCSVVLSPGQSRVFGWMILMLMAVSMFRRHRRVSGRVT